MAKKNGNGAQSAPRTDGPRWTRVQGTRGLGIVMIVKDEGHNLPALFEQLRDLADEVVVADTGSSDDTREVCREWGVRLLDVPWKNDFAYARNRTLQAARAKVLVWLDGDDRLPKDTRILLGQIAEDARRGRVPNAAYKALIVNHLEHGAAQNLFYQVRLFPNRAGVRFEGAVHEVVGPSLEKLGIPISVLEGFAIEHHGYEDGATLRAKAARNEALLLAQLRREGPTLHILVHLGQTVAFLGRVGEAKDILGKAIEYAEKAEPENVPEIRLMRAELLERTGDRLGARVDYEEAIRARPSWGVPRVQLAQLAAGDDEWEEAARLLADIDRYEMQTTFAAVPVTRLKAVAAWLKGVLARRAGDLVATRAAFQAALEIEPNFVPCRLDLGQLHLDAGDGAAAKAVLEPLGDNPAAAARIIDVLAAVALARVMYGEPDKAEPVLRPLLGILAPYLGEVESADVMTLAGATLKAGYPGAAANLVELGRRMLMAPEPSVAR